MSTGEHILTALAIVVGIGVVVLALIVVSRLARHDDARSTVNQARLFYRANHACDKHGGTLDIQTHRASWAFGPWIEIECGDATYKAVR